MRKRTQKRAAFILVAAMALSLAVPPMPAYALNYGESSTIRFDPGIGPELNHTTNGYGALPRDPGDLRVSQATGRAGYGLMAEGTFVGFSSLDNHNANPRPNWPNFPDNMWPGYVFAGWQNAEGSLVGWKNSSGVWQGHLPYAYPYENSTTYTAVWNGDTATPFDFTVMHYRDLNPARDGSNAVSAFPGAGATDLWKFFDSGSWVTSVTANTPISATYKRNIPGYKLKSVLIKNNNQRGYGQASGAGSMGEKASINPATKAVRGNMPNDDLTVAYRYEPDSTKKFPLQIKYVDEYGTSIKPADSYAYAAESSFSVAPTAITAYILAPVGTVTIDGGTDNLSGTGVYSLASAGYSVGTNHGVSGKMPNQPVTVTYHYKMDPGYTTAIRVNRVDNHGVPLQSGPEIITVSPNTDVEIDVPNKTGYVYPPNPEFTGTFYDIVLGWTSNKLTVKTDVTGGTITFTYTEDLGDPTNLGKVDYYHSQNGTITGDTSPRFFRIDPVSGITYDISELTDGIIITPDDDPYYVFDGWYQATMTGNNKTGSKLTGTVNLTGDKKLYANFVEAPALWHDISFTAGTHGSLSGSATAHVKRDTLWSTDTATPVPQSGYLFNGGYSEDESAVTAGMPILDDQTFTARFAPIGGDDGILSMPDAEGSVSAADGFGRIKVNGVNEGRKYVVTDEAGIVLEVRTGTQLLGQGFVTPYAPCTWYQVYEVTATVPVSAGTALNTQTLTSERSEPSRVAVSALGTNYQVTETSSGQKLTINPAASGNSYALLDATGAVAGDFRSGTVVFNGLEPGLYTVVARKNGQSISAAGKAELGSMVTILESTTGVGADYTLTLTNGGTVTEVSRNGVVQSIPSNAATVTVKAGDKIKLNAPLTDAGGNAFDRWNALIGSLPFTPASYRNATITSMPAGDLVLEATYQAPPPPLGQGRLKVDYSPKTGKFALNTESNQLAVLEAALGGNADDIAAITSGKNIDYTVKFNQRNAVTASESDAVRAVAPVSGSALRIPWALDTSLLRKVDGVSKPLVTGADITPAIEVYAALEASQLDQLDYQLWVVDSSGTCTEITSTVSPAPGPEGLSGSFLFEANVGDTIVLSYTRAYTVQVIDQVRQTVNNLRVRAGTALEDADDYSSLPCSDYTNPASGVLYQFQGFANNPGGSGAFAVTTPINTNKVLYAIYDDSLWQNAKDRLEDEIDIADALADSSISEEDRDRLEDAINDALDVISGTPGPSLSDLQDAYDDLHDLIQEILTGGGGGGLTPGTYVLTVEDGSGSGSYTAGTVITITANTPPSGKVFYRWTVTGGGALANAGSATTTYTMPAGAATVKATYKNSGGGSGSGGGGSSGGGSSSGSGGSGGSSSGKGPGGSGEFGGYTTYWNGIDGQWNNFAPATHGWSFDLSSGSRLKSRWANIRYTSDGSTKVYTYHFNADGVMDSNWYLDSENQWYFLSTVHDGWFGHLFIGWHQEQDGNWYYLNPFTGSMVTGWQQIDGQWYYFAQRNEGHIWGSMYAGTTTPDGYHVEADGRWIQETP